MAGLLDYIDPSLLGSGQQSEEEKKYARQQGLLSFAAAALANMYRPTGEGLGRGLAGGLAGYNEAQQTTRRNKLVDAENLHKAIQSQGMLNQFRESEKDASFETNYKPMAGPQLPSMAPTPQNAQALAAAPSPTMYDKLMAKAQAAYDAGRPAIGAKLVAEATKLRPEYSTTPQVGMDANGAYMYVIDKQGNEKRLGAGAVPKFREVNTGKVTKFVNEYGLPSAGTDIAMTTTPGQDQSNKLGWANYGLAKEAAARSAANQPAGEIKETADGFVRIGKDNSVTPIAGPGGAPLQPKPTGAVVQQIASNQVTLGKIDRAMVLVEKNPSAFGLKNVMGDTIMQRVNPSGVEARAMIADIAGQKIHDRSGAAVTVGEAERLKPYVPNATDDPATIKQKLALFKREYISMQKELAGGKLLSDVGASPAAKTVKWSDLP